MFVIQIVKHPNDRIAVSFLLTMRTVPAFTQNTGNGKQTLNYSVSLLVVVDKENVLCITNIIATFRPLDQGLMGKLENVCAMENYTLMLYQLLRSPTSKTCHIYQKYFL